jgi:crotonobetainyl-CoA:carnitine CoA-transferase CaiB-like acyl-CoA transferase
MHLGQTVLTALFERKKTGRERHVEMALFDCGLMTTSYNGLESMMLCKDPPRYGSEHPSIVPCGVFDAADGLVIIALGLNR